MMDLRPHWDKDYVQGEAGAYDYVVHLPQEPAQYGGGFGGGGEGLAESL
ncbi:hypothetical protein [Saccharopolyspora pogona]|nr:hypothetical protein [Saccharopolyspora pogona]